MQQFELCARANQVEGDIPEMSDDTSFAMLLSHSEMDSYDSIYRVINELALQQKKFIAIAESARMDEELNPMEIYCERYLDTYYLAHMPKDIEAIKFILVGEDDNVAFESMVGGYSTFNGRVEYNWNSIAKEVQIK
jgi:hypothetical protein